MTDLTWPTNWYWDSHGRNRKAGKPQTRTRPGFNMVCVVHTTDGPNDTVLHREGAVETAHYQATQKLRWSGYHFLIDRATILPMCDPEKVRAYHAGRSFNWKGNPGGGNRHVGISIAGRAREWNYTLPHFPEAIEEVLDKTAEVAVMLHRRFGIPLQRISIEEYKDGKPGVFGAYGCCQQAGGEEA